MKKLLFLILPLWLISCNQKKETEERGMSGYWLQKAEKPIVPVETKADRSLSRAALAGITYYVSTSGNNSNNGTSESTAWQSLSKVQSSIKDGDKVLFKRGDSFSGTLTVNVSNVTFGAYGSGNKPKLTGTGSRVSYLIYSTRSNLTFRDLEITDPKITDHTVRKVNSNIERAFTFEGTGCKIINCNISLVGVAAYFVGGSNTMDSCDVGNLRMVVNNEGGDNDYGANPVVISSAGNTITHNNFHDCWAHSYDYAYDGGAIEIYGSGTNNNVIMYNTMSDNNGLIEFGSGSGGTSSGNIIAYNKCINNGSVLWINNSGKFLINVTNLSFYNNVFVETVSQRLKESVLMSMATTVSNQIINLGNNIFSLTTGIDVARSGQFTGSQINRGSNIYNLSGGSTVNYSMAASEITATTSPFKTSTGNPLQWDYAAAIGKDKGIDVGIKTDFNGKAVSGLPDIGVVEEGSVTPPPNCVPATEERLINCPSGSTGIITEQRKLICPENKYTDWAVISNTCTTLPPPPCVPKTETRSIACPAGQTGTITQERKFDCDTNSWTAWANTGNNCITPPPPTQLSFSYANKTIYLTAPAAGSYEITKIVKILWFSYTSTVKKGTYPQGSSSIPLTLSANSYNFKTNGISYPFKVL